VYSVSKGRWSLTHAEPAAIFGMQLVGLNDGSVLAAPSVSRTHTGAGETFEPTTKRWKATHVTVARFYSANTLLKNGSVLIAGGCTDSCSVESVNSAVIYIPSKRKYVDVAPMNIGRDNASAVTLKDGRVLMQGGFASPGAAGPEIFTP
jgi:hypothetical protein